jgi:hypothetical protein
MSGVETLKMIFYECKKVLQYLADAKKGILDRRSLYHKILIPKRGKLECIIHFHPSLIFADKVGAYPHGTLYPYLKTLDKAGSER